MKAIWLFAFCSVGVSHCSAEIMLNDVVLGDADSYYLDEEWGKLVRPIRVAFEDMLTTDGFEFKPGSLEDIAAIWEVEISDTLTNSTYQNFTAIPDDRFRPMGDILAPGDSEYFGYGAVSFWMQNEQEPGFQVFGCSRSRNEFDINR